MTTRRRRTAALLLALAMSAAGCGDATVGRDAARCNIPSADVGTVEGWIGYASEHPDTVALLVDDGRGNRVEHRPDEHHPLASANKALNLVAYAYAVGRDRVDPAERVRVGDWERWSVVGSEQSHALALDSLGIPRNGERAATPDRTVTLDQIASVMVRWSDNAAPDLLRSRLGDQALLDAARVVGWNDPELPSTTGFLVSYFTPELLPPIQDRAARRSAEWQIARRYADDAGFRADVDSRPPPSEPPERLYNETGAGGSARQLTNLWSAVARGAFPGADRAQEIAERGSATTPPPGVAGVGAKGGYSPDQLARALYVRRDDGTIGTAVLLARYIDPADSARIAGDSQAFNDFLVEAVQDPSIVRTLSCRFPAQ